MVYEAYPHANCDVGHYCEIIDNLQVYAMVLPDHEINPRVPCKSGVLPRIDLNQWRDASFHSAPPKPSLSSHRFGKK